MCRNGDCKLRFSACDELLYARVCYDMSAHARNTSIEPLGDRAASYTNLATYPFEQPLLHHQIQSAKNTPKRHDGRLPTPSRPPLAQNKVLAIPRRRAPIPLCAKLSQTIILFVANPRALQHRYTKEFRLPRSLAKTVHVVQDLQTPALPDQSNATAGKHHHTLAVLLSQRVFFLAAESSTLISISSFGSNRKHSIQIAIFLPHTRPRIHGARRFETETETETETEAEA